MLGVFDDHVAQKCEYYLPNGRYQAIICFHKFPSLETCSPIASGLVFISFHSHFWEEVLDCWAKNDAKLYDHSMPVMISTRNLSKYREYPAHKLRNKTDSQKYKALKNEILKDGIREPLYVIVGKDGSAKIGEGNHRHNIALELRIPKVPVMFAFWDSAK